MEQLVQLLKAIDILLQCSLCNYLRHFYDIANLAQP